MHPETYDMLAGREDAYWWHVVRRTMSADLLKRHGVSPGGYWLDLGCGPGGNLLLPKSFGAELAVGVDLSPIALRLARRKKPQARLVCADLSNALPFAGGTFNAVTIFNVLYHDWVKSEAAVLAEVFRVLRPGGLLLVTEPAFTALSREMDVAAMGHRRYRRADFVRLCEAAGLQVRQTGYFSSFGFPALLAMKFLRRIRPAKTEPQGAKPDAGADMKPLNPVVNEWLQRFATLEARAIAAGLTVPFGTTLLCVARKP